jgi:hypothetical protein
MDPLEPVALRKRRRALELTQAELADHLVVSPTAVTRWEHGEVRIGHPQRVQRLLARRRRRSRQHSEGARAIRRTGPFSNGVNVNFTGVGDPGNLIRLKQNIGPAVCR